MSCPNECGVSTERRYLNHHLSNDCPHTVVNCDFHNVGCMVQLPRKDILAHNAKYVNDHNSLMIQNAEGREELRKENQILKDQVDKIQAELKQFSAAIEREALELQKKVEIQDQTIKAKLSEQHQELVELRNELTAP